MKFEGVEFPNIDVDYLPVDVWKAIRRPEWQNDAACRDVPSASHINTFYPETSKHGGNHLREPRAMCMRCPVRYECLEYGLEEPSGVWGGHSPSQRRRIITLVKKGSTLNEASKSIDARSRDARK